MIFKFTMAALVVLSEIPALTASTVIIREESSPSVLDRAIVIPIDDFTFDNIMQLATQFGSNEGRRYSLARLTIGTDSRTVEQALWHWAASSRFGDRAAAREAGPPVESLARVMAFDGGVYLSVRQKGTLTSRQVSGAPHAFVFLDDSHNGYELLHFKLTENRAPADPQDRYTLHVYFKAQPAISIGGCMALTRKLRTLTRVGLLTASVRTDVWFPEDQDYPDVFPFTEDISIPTKAHYQLGPNATCSESWRRQMTCAGNAFGP